jgi:hypothetical protein
MYCNVCATGKTLLSKVKDTDTELVKWSGAPAGLSEVRWTRTTIGGPSDLGGSVANETQIRNSLFTCTFTLAVIPKGTRPPPCPNQDKTFPSLSSLPLHDEQWIGIMNERTNDRMIGWTNDRNFGSIMAEQRLLGRTNGWTNKSWTIRRTNEQTMKRWTTEWSLCLCCACVGVGVGGSELPWNGLGWPEGGPCPSIYRQGGGIGGGGED